MDIMKSKDKIEQLINTNQMVLIYFGSKSCSVCQVLKPKVIELLKDYPNIMNAQVLIDESLEVSASYNIFTIPAVLLFIEGKEVIREARHISMQDLNNKISRYYQMIFE